MIFNIEEALTREEAVRALATRWDVPQETESVRLEDAYGRVTAQDCCARYNLPVYRVSSFDGIAIDSAVFEAGVPDTTTWKRGVDFAQADTGDDFPDTFDTVIAAEDVEYAADGHPVLAPGLQLRKGNAVKPAGATIKEGELLCAKGRRLRPEDVALLAAGGYAQIDVVRQLRIGYIPTGNELVPVGATPGRGENIQSNSLMLAGYAHRWGAKMISYDIVPDDADQLRTAIRRALDDADIVLINGGSSRGSEDYCSQLLQERASYFSHGIKAVPGRPIGLSVIDGKPAINVPGPMIAAWLANDWLVRALVCHYYGLPIRKRRTVPATLDVPLHGRAGFERLVRMIVTESNGEYRADTVPDGSTLAANMRCVNGFFALQDGESFEAGDMVDVELLGTSVC